MAKKSDIRKAEADARAAEAKAKQADAERAARTEEAKAGAVRAEAEAKAAEAKARVDEINANAAAKNKEREDAAGVLKAQQARDADPLRQAWKVGTTLAAPVAGVLLGHRIAHGIELRDLTATRAANKEITALGDKAGLLLDRIGNKKPTANQARKLESIATAAKEIKHGATPGKFGMRSLRGPLGLAVAGVLLAEAGLARFYLAPNTPNEQAKDLINATATGSIFTATSLIGERVVHNVTMKAVPSATSLANITAAGEIGGASLGKVAVTAAKGARVLSKLLPGIGIALAVGGAIYAGIKAAHAGESLPVIARETALGAVGLDGMIPSSRPASTTYLNDGAAKRAEVIPPRATRSPATPTSPRSDGTTAAYTRRGRNGGVVSVGTYATPKRG